MHYMHNKMGWYCQFLMPDLKTPLRRKLVFQDSGKVMELAMRGGADTSAKSRQELDEGILLGRGDAWLYLTPEQYNRLR